MNDKPENYEEDVCDVDINEYIEKCYGVDYDPDEEYAFYQEMEAAKYGIDLRRVRI
ncbi:MAG: hypothetical protein HQM11_07820 [SAR324 cluster bacterium]|nr:hypothetical protein [SAR324 cluster bacterium]